MPDADFWQTSPVEALKHRLEDGELIVGEHTAALVRDRAAALLHSAPKVATMLAAALLAAAARGHADAAVQAVAWRCRAEAHLFSGEQRQARAAYERATRFAEAAGATQLLGQILVGRVGLLNLLGEQRAARQLAARAERLLRQCGDRDYLGKLHLNQGNTAYDIERYEEALASYQRAQPLLAREGVAAADAVLAGLHMNMAIAATHLGRLDDARELFGTCESLCAGAELAVLHAQSRFNRALLEQLDGNYRVVLTLLEDAASTFDAEGASSMGAAARRARAEAYLELNLPAEALSEATAAHDAFANQHMAIDAQLALVVKARSLLAASQPRAAIDGLSEAHAFFANRRIRPRQASIALYLARAHLLLDEPTTSSQLARRALRTFEQIGAPAWSGRARLLLAEAELARGRWRRADQELGPALRASRSYPPAERWQLWELAGRIASARGDTSRARRAFRRSVRLLEQQRLLIPGIELRARAFERQVRVYYELVDLLLTSRRSRLETLFTQIEAARSRGFRERRAEISAGGAAGPNDDAPLATARRRLGSLTLRLEQAELEVDGTASAPRHLQELRREMRAVERQIETRLTRLASRSADDTLPRPEAAAHAEVGACLASDEALIEYFVTERHAVALVLRRSGSDFRILPRAPAALRRHTETLTFQLDGMALAAAAGVSEDPAHRRRATDHLLTRLHDDLIAPVADLLPARGHLIIVPHRFLHEVPFECLHDGDDYIGHRYVMTRSPTADLVLSRRRRVDGYAAHGSENRASVTAQVTGGPPAVTAEVRAIADSLPEARVFIDPSASDLQEQLAGPGIVHISAHGHFRADNPWFSRLATSDGGLFVIDLTSRAVQSELVVLSACNSGRVFGGLGDELAGVSHAILAAGAGTLVASRWRVHDAATSELMRAFYTHLRGTPATTSAVASCLAAASAEIAAAYPHPFYWGAFSAYGA